MNEYIYPEPPIAGAALEEPKLNPVVDDAGASVVAAEPDSVVPFAKLNPDNVDDCAEELPVLKEKPVFSVPVLDSALAAAEPKENPVEAGLLTGSLSTGLLLPKEKLLAAGLSDLPNENPPTGLLTAEPEGMVEETSCLPTDVANPDVPEPKVAGLGGVDLSPLPKKAPKSGGAAAGSFVSSLIAAFDDSDDLTVSMSPNLSFN